MKLVTLAFALAVLAPSVAAGIAWLDHTDPAAVAQDGCHEMDTEVRCDWSLDTTTAPATTDQSWPIPAFNKTLARVIVQFEGEDRGWQIVILPAGENSNAAAISRSSHPAGATPPSPRAVETTTHVLLGATAYRLKLDTTDYEVNSAKAPGAGPASLGTFHVTYIADPLPEGVPPARPAATRDFPQIVAPSGDARHPEYDLLAAWLDEPKVGDGLLGAHLAVTNLSHIDYDAPGVGQVPANEVTWNIHFNVSGIPYVVQWSASPGGNGAADTRACELAVDTNFPAAPQVIAQPACTWDVPNSTLEALIPIESLGAAGTREPWHDLTANVDTRYAANQYPQSEDKGLSRFSFALSPSEWDSLNGCHFCPPPTKPWWEDPLASDNLPNSVQVAGAVIAVIGFFGGIVLFRTRRAKVRALLREIERVETEHERSTREALLALGQLDSTFADMYHRGKLTDDQYQVVAQRLATVATRFALRQGLGLDDGVAGDGRVVRVPVRTDAPREEARP